MVKNNPHEYAQSFYGNFFYAHLEIQRPRSPNPMFQTRTAILDDNDCFFNVQCQYFYTISAHGNYGKG